MPLYPSLEQMKLSSLLESQGGGGGGVGSGVGGGYMTPWEPQYDDASVAMQPIQSHADLLRNMGYEATSFHFNNLGELVPSNPSGAMKNDDYNQAGVNTDCASNSMALCPVAPSGPLALFQHHDIFDKVEIKAGIRLVTLCKNDSGKVGIQLKDIEKGIFVSFVEGGSPAALAGVRFGDQVLEINNILVAGYTGSKAMDLLKNSSPNNIRLAIRDRPFERVVTVHKDGIGTVGVEIRHGLIKAIVKDSSAARNGLLTNHHIIEVNGKNVVGLKDKALTQIIDECTGPVKFTIIPKSFYDKLTKNLSTGQMRVQMDRSLPVA
ncbi:unnamed protein product [Trichobilharzia szidati]|nr:unnamed protein product [Trichobilharzia szidati]